MNAYLDWSGLRPMTELEYEKACRGPILPKPGEFAWGNASITALDNYALINTGQPNESINNLPQNIGNAIYSNSNGAINGPVRNGIFASSATNKTRQETGGSYYGVMELTGNLYERCITVGTVQGRNFTGFHGNGIISPTTANGTTLNYPNNVTGNGYGFKGGSFINGFEYIRVSDRFDGASAIPDGNNRIGIRAVRTAP